MVRSRYQKQCDPGSTLPLRSKLANGVIPANNEQRCRPGTTCPDRQSTCKFGLRCAMLPTKQYHGPRSDLQVAGSQALGKASQNDLLTAIISNPRCVGCVGPLIRNFASLLRLMTVHRQAAPGAIITKQGPNMLATRFPQFDWWGPQRRHRLKHVRRSTASRHKRRTRYITINK